MAHTDHDETFNRATWTGEAWLGVESFIAPTHEGPRNVTGGLEAWLEEHGVEVMHTCSTSA
jgi:hypothetical protein